MKIGGFPAIVNVLVCPHPSLQSRAAEVIGYICQNNIEGQKEMFNLHVFPKLLNMLDSHKNVECKVKAMFALSGN